MKVRYTGKSFGIDSLTDGKVYEVLSYDEISGGLRVVDDSGEDYLYSPWNPRPLTQADHLGGRFEIVEDDEARTLHRVIIERDL